MKTGALSLLVLITACGSSATEGGEASSGSGGATVESGGASAAGSRASGSGGQVASVGGAAGEAVGGNSSGEAGGVGGARATGGASGSLGASGSAGEGGAPHVVEACPTGSRAPSKVGVWEDITPQGLNRSTFTPIGAIVVNPKDTRIVYAGSEGSGLFKSTDCGASFVKINTGTNGSHISSGRMWDMVIDPVDPQILYVIEGYGDGGLWKTTNGGVDWVNTTPKDSNVGQTANGNFTSIVGMDVTNHEHLVLAFHSGCGGAYAPNCQAETTDGGATWRLFKTTVGGEGVGVIVLDANSWVSAEQETTDRGATWHSIAGGSAHWQLYQSPTSGAFYIGTQQGILKSTDGKSWNLIPGFKEHAQGITGDGTNIYAGQQWGSGLFKIPEKDPGSYTPLPPTDGNGDGPYFMSYDMDHRILYSSEFQGAHWRMLMQ